MTDELPSIRKIERKIDSSNSVIEEKILEVKGEDIDEVKKIFDERWKK